MSDAFAVLIISAAGGLAVVGVVLGLRSIDQNRRDDNRRLFEVNFPRTVTADQVRAFVATLAGLATPGLRLRGQDSAVLEVVGGRLGLVHRLRLPGPSAAYFVMQLRAVVPGVAITEIGTDDKPVKPLVVGRAHELRLVRRDMALTVPDAGAVSRTVLAACLGLRGGESVVWAWVVSGGTPSTPSSGDTSWTPGTVWHRLTHGTSDSVRPAKVHPEDGLIRATLRLGATAAAERRERELLARLRRATASVSSPGARLVPRLLPRPLVAGRIVRGATPLVEASALLPAAELVALVAWPIGGPMLPGLVLGGSPQLPVSPAVPRSGRVLGRATVGEGRLVAQGVRAATEHTLLVGPTGSGKTWLAVQLALGDIAAGRGGLVLDPKGGTIRAILERLPEGAIGRTVVVDPTDEVRPVPLPLLAHEAGGIPELAADTLVGLLRHRYSDLGPRSTDILSSSLYALARVPDATLFDLLRLWSNTAYRARVVAQVADDPALTSFFAWFDGLAATERNFILAAPMNKIRPLLQRSALRNVLAAPSATFTLAEALANRLVVLVSLPEGILGADATTLLGQVVLARAWAATQGRARTGGTGIPFFITVDESPRFVDQPTDLGDVLARSREYGVGVTLITQSLSLFPNTLRGIAINSLRTKVAFGEVADDARRLADAFGPTVTPDMLSGLAAFEAIGSVSVGGAVSDPFTFKTLPLEPPIPGRAKAVRSASRNRWGIPRAEIEASFKPRGPGPGEGAGPVGRRQLP
jgi:hypothetical protein